MASSSESIPPTKPLPVTKGRLADFSRDVLQGLLRLHLQHGPIAALEDGIQRIVFLFDPLYNKQVLSDTVNYEARFFAIRGPRSSPQRRVTCGLLAMNGEQHRRNRRLVKEPFSLRSIASYGESIDQLTQELVESWRAGQQFDLNAEMTRFMLGVTSSVLFGIDQTDEAYELGEQIAHWVNLTHDIGAGALVHDEGFTQRYEELLDFAGQLEANVLRMIRRRRENPTDARDVLSILVASKEEGGLSDEELVGQACVLFAAAHMTTAHSLTWTLMLLAQHPETMQRLVAESPTVAAGFDEADSRELPLVERVVKESMRVLPASAYSQRITAAPVTLGPFDLPRGVPIIFTPLITHRLPQLYPDPLRFDPERWLALRPSAYEYHPFGAGSRMCIGGPLAMEILRTAIPRIVQRWKLSVVPGSRIDAEVRSTMLNPATGVPVMVAEHDGQFTASATMGSVHELVTMP